MMGYGMMGSGMLFFMIFWWVVIIAGIIFAGYGIIQIFRSKKIDNNSVTKDPLELLKLRYVSGEISQEEYNERKKILLS